MVIKGSKKLFRQNIKRFRSARVLLVALLYCTLSVAVPVAANANNGGKEYQIKAAFLYNFLKFITWENNNPKLKTRDITLCVIGEDPFGNILKPITRKKISGKNIKLAYPETVEDSRQCHLLFVGKKSPIKIMELNEEMAKSSVLTVSDLPRFLQQSGMIEFFSKNEKIQFSIEDTLTEEAGIKVSSKLLELSKAH